MTHAHAAAALKRSDVAWISEYKKIDNIVRYLYTVGAL
jgi:hypothetical protein